MNPLRRTVALVGGGRWGRVHASNLSVLLKPGDRVIWISRYNQAGLADFVRRLPVGPHFELAPELSDALRDGPVAAVVVTSPETHFAIANKCLQFGVHTFVEKPLAFKASEARILVDIAAKQNLLLAAGLHLLSASYLAHFRNQLSNREVCRISLRWFDPAHEQRHGEIKTSSNASPIIHDLYPHLWSIIKVMTGSGHQEVKNVSKSPDGFFLFRSSAGLVEIEARFGRFAEKRERNISVFLRDGGCATFDFTNEPGDAMLDDVPLSPDPEWGRTPRPVMAEVKDFFEEISAPIRDEAWPHLAANCIDSVIGAEILHASLRNLYHGARSRSDD